MGGTDPWEDADFARTKGGDEGGGLAGGERLGYGLAMSCTQGQEARTGYGDEPWHVRDLGRERAATFRASRETLREWVRRRG